MSGVLGCIFKRRKKLTTNLATRYYGDDFKYRIGTIILHKTKDGVFDIVDGQQRIISLVLLKQCIEPEFECILYHSSRLKIAAHLL